MWSSLRANLTDPATGLCPLVPEYQDLSQLLELVDYSQDAWYASPPSQISLLQQLEANNTEARARLSISFSRQTGGDVAFDTTSNPMDSRQLVGLLQNASHGTAGQMSTDNATVKIDQLFPQAIHLYPKEGAAAEAVDVSRKTFQSAYLGLHAQAWPPNANSTDSVVMYWVLYGSSSVGSEKGFNVTVVSERSIAGN